MKQTAVNYLIHSINEELFQLSKSESEWKEIFKQAKAMEKEQIINAFNDGINDECLGKNTTPEQYYKKNYGK